MYTDLNRVEVWCKYLADTLTSYSYPVTITTKINWIETDFPTALEMERIRSNVLAIKTAYYSFTAIPENLDYMTYQKANAIEKILDEVDKIIGYMENNFVYCGVGGCGQERVWQQRFRRPKTWISQFYRFNQYTETDTIAMIATDSDKTIQGKTDKLELAQIDKRDDVWASIEAMNNSMTIIDTLVGGGE